MTVDAMKLCSPALLVTTLLLALTPATAQPPELSISASASRDPVGSGRLLTYTLVCGNAGGPAADVTVTAATPASTTFQSATPAASSDPGVGGTGTVSWDVADLPQGGGGVVTNPDAYLFWDGVHPTRIAHAMLGEAAALVINPPPPAIPGDFDADGDVDVDDFDVLSAHYGQTGLSAAQGDADGDGDADLSDFSIVALHFGAATDGPTPEQGLAWAVSDEGKRFTVRASEEWAKAHVADGADPEDAARAAATTAAMYTGETAHDMAEGATEGS